MLVKSKGLVSPFDGLLDLSNELGSRWANLSALTLDTSSLHERNYWVLTYRTSNTVQYSLCNFISNRERLNELP